MNARTVEWARRGPLRGLRSWWAAAWAFSLVACQSIAEPIPAVVRVSALPDRSPEAVVRQHGLLVEEVCRRASLECAWVPAQSYEALVDDLGRGAIDLAYLGGVTFVQAHHRHGVIPLVIRDIDAAFTTAIVVRADSTARELSALRGKAFAFGPRSSTSGTVMPWHFLEREGLDPKSSFARVVYTSGHDETVRAVASGEVDAGAVNGSILLALAAEGTASANTLRVLWRTEPYTDYVWAVRPGTSPELRQRLLDAFLDLDASTSSGAEALRREGARVYLPARADDWELLATLLAARGAL
ncbi:phosphate/phosphite/phosphonate ABC transporter substrate-binding protein [Myxococcota bacterium]|nr:phosphate/phosphite/phosphonate ABC transporter substrate-binding protein [Myxococcota bacterium]